VYSYFADITASSTLADDVTYYIMHKILIPT